jgi:hypothetical protein
MRLAIKSTGQGRQVWRDKGHGLGGEAAQRTLIATMAGRRVLGRRFVVVDLDAELGGVAKERLKLGGNRRVIGAGEGGRGKRRRRRGGEKLNDKRECDNEDGEGRTPSDRPIAALPRSTPHSSVAAAHRKIHDPPEFVRRFTTTSPREASTQTSYFEKPLS